jgi:CRP/FNR family transcriptional regulator, cyclic AMP receptor protein
MKDSKDLLKLLKAVELFIGLNDQQLQRLIDISTEKTFKAGDVIFNQGSEGDKLYLLRQGQVEVRVETDAGQSRSQIYLGQGQIFGEMALIDYGRRSATVRAITDGTVVDVIERDAFTRLCDEDNAIGYIVMRNMAVDLSFKLRHRNLDPNAE